jgi:hypothetical protein
VRPFSLDILEKEVPFARQVPKLTMPEQTTRQLPRCTRKTCPPSQASCILAERDLLCKY